MEPTAAGNALYRNGQTILRVEQARQDVATSGAAPSGRVAVSTALLQRFESRAPLFSRFARRHPDVTPHLTEIFGGVLSKAIKNGRLDIHCNRLGQPTFLARQYQ